MTRMSRWGARFAAFAGLAGAITLTVGTTADATVTQAYARLYGANETPANASVAVGTVVVTVDTTNLTVCTAMNFARLSAPATAAHIHKAAVGVPGPVVVPLTGLPSNVAGGVNSCAVVSRDLAIDIAAHPSNYYVNVHDAVYPGGEIRGQLAPAVPAAPAQP